MSVGIWLLLLLAIILLFFICVVCLRKFISKKNVSNVAAINSSTQVNGEGNGKLFVEDIEANKDATETIPIGETAGKSEGDAQSFFLKSSKEVLNYNQRQQIVVTDETVRKSEVDAQSYFNTSNEEVLNHQQRQQQQRSVSAPAIRTIKTAFRRVCSGLKEDGRLGTGQTIAVEQGLTFLLHDDDVFMTNKHLRDVEINRFKSMDVPKRKQRRPISSQSFNSPYYVNAVNHGVRSAARRCSTGRQNFKQGRVFDLHRMQMVESFDLLKANLPSKLAVGEEFNVITGRGNHSHNGPVLRPAVIKWLALNYPASEGYSIRLINRGGHIIVSRQ